MTMGTASTMTAVAEVLGMTLPGALSIPAVHAGHARAWPLPCGTPLPSRYVWGRPAPERRPLNGEAFDNAVTADMAIGGSTNAIIHFIAMVGCAGIRLPLERFDSQKPPLTPVIA